MSTWYEKLDVYTFGPAFNDFLLEQYLNPLWNSYEPTTGNILGTYIQVPNNSWITANNPSGNVAYHIITTTASYPPQHTQQYYCPWSIPVVDDDDNILYYINYVCDDNIGNGIALSTSQYDYVTYKPLSYSTDYMGSDGPSGRKCRFDFKIVGNILYATAFRYGDSTYYDIIGRFILNLDRMYELYGGHIKSEYVSDEYGTPSEEGGYTGGTFDDSSDTIAIPTMPTIGVTSAGFVNVYNPSVGALQGFGAELFPDLTFSSSSHISGSASVADAIEAAANALVDLGNQIPNIVNMYINSNLINYVIDCHILPVAPTVGAGANIKVGFKQFNATAPVVTSDYVDFDCGTLNVGEYYANFIDYSPYTRARLFLPFVGFVDLQPEFFQSGAVNIVYRFNIIDGSFMCYVLSTSSKSKLTNSVIMQFGGNACVHIPITGLNYSSMVSGVVGGAASMVASQAGVSGLNQRAGSAITSAITSAVDVAQSKPPVQASNGYNATTSFLSVRTPYLLIERSVSNFSMNYTEEKGVPSNITSDFSTLTGFTQATAVHLDGIGATEEEKAEISALLAQGVIL